MSNVEKPLIAVLGATGSQGRSVVQSLLDDPDHAFRVRGLTRKTDSPKAQELVAMGAEVVQADLDDVESLRKAFQGAYGVFGVTNFWEVFSEEKETQQGKNIADAVVSAGVKHLVWSTLDHTSDPAVKHCNSKAAVDDYLKEKKIPHTSLYTVFYFENFLTFSPLKNVDGKVVADWPLLLSDGPLGGYSVTDTGSYVLEAFKKPDVWLEKDLRILSEVFTPRQFVQAVKEVIGKDIELVETDRARFDSLKETQYELWSNMQFFYKHNGNPNRDPELTLSINPSRKGLKTFVEANKGAFTSIFND